MTEHDLTEAECDVELKHIADAARRIADDDADPFDAGRPGVITTLTRFAAVIAAIALLVYGALNFRPS